MKLSNLRTHVAFQTILLLFCLFAGQTAIADVASLPALIVGLLNGKTADYNNIASRIPEHQLPVALAAAGLLKFRALHGESSLSINEATAFEELLLGRMSSARLVAFSKNEICRKMVPQHEVEFNGQKLIVPMHYLADMALTVIDFRPQGEAGCLFPDFNIEVFSQTRLIKVTLAIDGRIVDSGSILLKQHADCFSLRHRPAMLPENMRAIGTHSAHISITNEAGEKTEKNWLFTIGVESFNPEPVPEDARLLDEISVPGSRLIANAGGCQNVRVRIYEDGNGGRHEEYVVATGKGSITVRNLKYLGKILTSSRSDAEFQIFPKTGNAFPGNRLRFFYSYAGEGRVVESEYSLNGLPDTWQNGAAYEATLASEAVRVFFRIKVEKPDPEAKNETISLHYQADHSVSPLFANFRFLNPRNYVFTKGNEAFLPFKRELQVNGVAEALETGAKISFNGNGKGTLTVDDFRAEIVVSSGSVTLKDNIATVSEIIFASPGYIEITQSARLVYSYDDETYSQSFKDEKSSLNALFKVNAGCEFLKYPQVGLISGTQVEIPLKHLSLQINGETRLYKSLADIRQPWVLLESEHDPRMAPIVLQNPYFHIEDPAGKINFGLVDFGYRVLAAVTDEPFAVNPEFGVTPGLEPIKFASLQEFSIFPVDSRLVEVEIDPPGPHKIFEGDTRPFSAAIVPVEGMGTGHFNAEENSLEILDFYQPSEIDYFTWLELPVMDEKVGRTIRETEFEHLFNPWWGPGEYELSVDSLVDFKTEAGSTFYLKAANKTEVEVMPGLTILSPISDVAYPLGASLKVTTSVDDNLEKWKSIKWSLNGKDFRPDTQEPPFFITPDRAGKYSLIASLTIDADADREPVVLVSEVKFSVQAVDYSLSPNRKVFPRAEASDIAVDLIVRINGKQVEKPGQAVPWQEDALSAAIDKVEWDLIQKEDGCASLEAAEDSFKAMVDFSSHGAATVLATITIRLIDAEKKFNRHNPHFKNRFEEPVFKLPAARADLWAVSVNSVDEMDSPENSFPDKAITGAYRTYELRRFSFLLHTGEKNYTYDNQVGWSEPVVLQPALPGIENIAAKALDLIWEAKSDSGPLQKIQESSTKLVVKPSVSGKYNVSLEVLLPLSDAGTVKVAEKNTVSHAVDLFSLIEVSVEPSSFTLSLGDSKTLHYRVKSIENQPALQAGHAHIGSISSGRPGSVLYLLNNSYSLWIDKVQWSDNQSSQSSDPLPTASAPNKETIESNAYEFNAGVPGQVKGLARGSLNVSELLPNDVSARVANYPKDVTWAAYIQELSVEILVNGQPAGELEYYLGQKISLSYRLKRGARDNFKLDNPVWEISGPKVKAYDPWVVEDNPRPCKADILTAEELAAESVALFLYCLDDENYQKTISIRGQIPGGHGLAWPCTAVTNIKIQHPELVEPFPEVPGATMSYYLSEDSLYAVYYLGYEAKSNAGPVFEPTVSNQTKINYLVGALQLVMNNHWRKLKEYGENGISTEKEEVAMTLPLNKKWLDQQFSYKQPQSILAGMTGKIPEVYWDSPGVDCDAGHPKYVEKVFAEAEYTLFFMVKPAGTSVPYEESIWVPLKAFTWRWGGQAKKQPDDTWLPEGSVTSEGFIAEKLSEIVEWETVANKNTIKWRLKQ